MKEFPGVLVVEKNKLNASEPWLLLIHIKMASGGTDYYYARNVENVTFNAQTYTAFPFEVDSYTQGSKGQIPTLLLRVSNVMRVVQSYIEAENGAVGSGVTLTIMSNANPTADHTNLQMNFDVLSTYCDDEWVGFSLGAPNPLRKRYPLYKYVADHCNWIYKGVECTYASSLSSCTRTYQACVGHQAEAGTTQLARFGGFKGLTSRGIKVV